MKLNRKEFLERACRTGLAIFGSTALFEVLSGRELMAGVKNNPSAVRWAMAVDIPKFVNSSDYERCIQVCNKIHNIPQMKDKRHEIKWIWKEKYEHAFPEQSFIQVRSDLKERDILVMCNQCNNPPCVRVCPTQATWQRNDGIVMMDMHRCIGCRYCMAACPYGSRSFNFADPRKYLDIDNINMEYPTRTRGVVEKCDMCAERIDIGLKPLCVDACRDNSLIFGNLNDPKSDIRRALKKRYAIRRKPSLGTEPQVYYLV